MKTKTDILLPPFLFPGKTAKEKAYLGKLKKEGKIRSIGPRLFTSLPEKKVNETLKKSWALIVSNLFPNALIGHATALSYAPTTRGEIFITSTRNRNVRYLNLTLVFIKGPAALSTDLDFVGIKASSFPRALLENLTLRKGNLKNGLLSQEEIEKRLEEKLLREGEIELNRMRDQAKEISSAINRQTEFKRLDAIIGALLGTRDIAHLTNDNSFARANNYPYDVDCYHRLEILFGHLRHLPMKEVFTNNYGPNHFQHKAFFESYFSNYIEGTIFEIREAERIVFDKVISQTRPKDAHDILETFNIVSDFNEMKTIPDTFNSFLEILKRRHFQFLEKRPEVNPGVFKKQKNHAGNTFFVHPDYVVGTLKRGFELYHDLPVGMKRAIFMMFLISDIHPFTDGNGRIARMMMNAELFSTNLSTIIIPTVFRDDYIFSLRALTRRHDPDPFVRMLIKAQNFSFLNFSNYVEIKDKLIKMNWFCEPDEAKLIFP